MIWSRLETRDFTLRIVRGPIPSSIVGSGKAGGFNGEMMPRLRELQTPRQIGLFRDPPRTIRSLAGLIALHPVWGKLVPSRYRLLRSARSQGSARRMSSADRLRQAMSVSQSHRVNFGRF
jgi:hypothetical protein